MAVFYEKEINDRKAIYEAAEKWKLNCLLNNKSLIWDGESVWTDDHLKRFRAIFVENPDESGDSFDSKLKNQLENESEGVYKLVIEIMFIYYLFPYNGSITFKTKMDKLIMIASWKGIQLDHSLEIFHALKDGLGSTGTFYNTSKYFEISFLFLVVEKLKGYPLVKRKKILNDYKLLKDLADKTREQVGKRVQILHIFLHLLLPEYFERIASWGHKMKIANAYSEYITNPSIKDTDEQLFMIREKLQEGYPREQIDFYETPEIEKVWRKNKNSTGEKEEISVQSINNRSGETDMDYWHDKNIILYGPPGTGKTYNTVKYAVAIIEKKSIKEIDEEVSEFGYEEIIKRYND
jgi:hypothetical protein